MAHEVTFYTRQGCSLCDHAKAAVEEAISRHGLDATLHAVDIDRDPALRERFTSDVPVIYVDGVEAFRHRVTSEQMAAYLRDGAAPATGLAAETCIPCRGGVPPLKGTELADLHRELGNDWRVIDDHHLEKEFTFPDFAQALAFTNRVGALAEQQAHHPDICIGWGRARITIWTHKADGLTRADFVLAAKIDAM